MSYSFEIPSSSRLYIYALLFSTSADFVTVLVGVKVKKILSAHFLLKVKVTVMTILTFITLSQESKFSRLSLNHIWTLTQVLLKHHTRLCRDYNSTRKILITLFRFIGVQIHQEALYSLLQHFSISEFFLEIRTCTMSSMSFSPVHQIKEHGQRGPNTDPRLVREKDISN